MEPTIIKTVVDGKELELVSCGIDATNDAQWVLLMKGEIVRRQNNQVHEWLRYFREVKPQYTFNVLTLEPTGEKRPAKAGDFFLNGVDHVQAWALDWPTIGPYPILKVVKSDH